MHGAAGDGRAARGHPPRPFIARSARRRWRPEAHSILQRAGFVPVVRLHKTHHRAPAALVAAEEAHLATKAVLRLGSAGYDVGCDAEFHTVPHTHHHLRSAHRSHSATPVHEAASTGAAATVLTELTAPHDGIVAAIDDILRATADFPAGLDQAADPHIARRLHRVADEHLRAIRTDLAYTHNALADRHTPVLARSGRPEQRPVREAKTLHDVRVPAAVA